MLEKDPRAGAHLDLAKTYAAINDMENAKAEYEATVAAATARLEQYPDSADVHFRGLAYFALGEYAKATDDLTKGLAALKEEFYFYGARATYFTERAAVYEALGDTANAEADRAEAARLNGLEFARLNAPPDEAVAEAEAGEGPFADLKSGAGGIRSLHD